MKTYKGDYLNKIAFPLGGIGSGSISLSGSGTLIDPEINNKPNRGADCGFSSFAIRAEKEGKIVDCRMLCGDREEGLMKMNGDLSLGFRHFDKVYFSAEYPFAKVYLSDSLFPGEAEILAFNPFIPTCERDSSIPAAFFEITVKNTSEETLTYSILQNMTNLVEGEGGLNEYFETSGIKGITLNSKDSDKESPTYGNITIATDFEKTSHTDYWFRGSWFDKVTWFRNDFLSSGELNERTYSEAEKNGKKDTASLAAHFELAPKEEKRVRFLISWFVPNAKCDWKEEEFIYKNYYSTIFKSSKDVVSYCFSNWERLYGETALFAKRLYSSSLPEEVKYALSGNIAILKSSTCLRLEDGSFWAWEGVWNNGGSCEGTCQHVYNYAYAMAFLFPRLERELRNNEIKYSLEDDGKMNFRMHIGLKRGNSWRACVDGQMGFVIKCFREWKLSGDNGWLKANWEKIKLALSYAWSENNPDKWDMEKSGVIRGRQHHTLDVELFGVHSWLTGMYHAALAAAAEMAKFMGEDELFNEYKTILEKGKKTLDGETFNGEYFIQSPDINDKSIIEDLTKSEVFKNLIWEEEDSFSYYWDKTLGEAKYQIGKGCEIDQVLADWHTDLCGIENVFNPEHRKSALKAIYKYNFCDMHSLLNPCRVFACNDEKGVVMCSWKDEGERPSLPIPYAEECMSGFEYAFAANMLQCGMEKEALEVIGEIRRRYNGKRRNPFSELECGASYGRAMASYSLLVIYSGFKFDMPNKIIGFKPIKHGSYFWSLDGAFGNIEITKKKQVFTVDFGELELKGFITHFEKVSEVKLNGESQKFGEKGERVFFDVKLKSGDVLEICGE